MPDAASFATFDKAVECLDQLVERPPEPSVAQLRRSADMVHGVKDISDALETSSLGEFEQFVLLALVRLGPEAYGAAIRREIEARSDRRLSISAVYTTLDRLEQKGYVRSWVGEPTPQRGGRRKKHFALEPVGARALQRSYRAFAGMVDGLEELIDTL